MAIRILIADDHPIVREGLVAVLETQPDFEIAGEAASGAQAVERAAALRPDVILLDLELPELDGVAALRAIRAADPAARAIIFTAFDTDERILGAVQAGAQGYLLKGAPREDLFQAIRVVHGGGSLLQPVVAARLLRQVSSPSPAALPEPLTERELEVLRLLARGRQNKEIAGELWISERTVKFHVSGILAKLGVGNRTEAVSKAAQLGLVEL
ncbi:MAG: response regulator transcription factor [Kouleothrix sp.]|nr:response regulator transcription factor [Kouleothrix sp.]